MLHEVLTRMRCRDRLEILCSDPRFEPLGGNVQDSQGPVALTMVDGDKDLVEDGKKIKPET